jgi:hypothetical protein
MKSKLGQQKLNSNTKVQLPTVQKQNHLQSSNISANNSSKEIIDSSIKIDKLLDTTVSYKDIPLMKDLLNIQKKIRSLLEDWLSHIRNSLGIMQPNMYILPDLPQKHKTSRLNEHHSDYYKIVFHRRKSKSVENLMSATPLFEALSSCRKVTNKAMYSFNSLTTKKSDQVQRSQSAYISMLNIQYKKYQFKNILLGLKV